MSAENINTSAEAPSTDDASPKPSGITATTDSSGASDAEGSSNSPDESSDNGPQSFVSETATAASEDQPSGTAPAEIAANGPAEAAIAAHSPADAVSNSTPTADTPDADASAADTRGQEAQANGSGDAAAGAETGGDGQAIRADGDGAKKKRRRRRKKKKKSAGDGAEAAENKKPATERSPFHAGEEVFGRVTAVLSEAIMVDLSGKALGIFDRREMEPDDLLPSEGDRFLARVHQDGARGGLVVLTRKPLREEEARPVVEAALKSGDLIEGLVTGVIKGGVDVDINGLRAFAPGSGMDLHPQNANFGSLVGQRMEFKVTQYEANGRDVVVTRRPMLEAEAHERRKHALTLLKEEQVLPGVVRTIVEWGVFVAMPDAENLEGLVHATEASHDPRARLTELFKPGDKIDVKITKIDDRGKIWLSRKALVADPWKEAKEKYPPGHKFTTTITRLEKFGAFCQLEGIEGLIHIGDLSLKKIEHPSEVLKVDQELEVVVHQFDLRNHKVALHPALTGDQANEERQKVARNANVMIEVVKPESAGLVVRVLGATGRGARGFVPAGQTGTERGTDLRKKFPPGAKFKATVIDLDPRRGEPKLSIRRFHENEERSAHREYRKQVASESFGTLGDLLKRMGK